MSQPTISSRQDMFYWQVDRPFSPEEVKKIFLDRADNFDTDLAKQAVTYALKQLGDTRKVEFLHSRHTAGSVNLVYRVTLGDKSEVIIRIHPTDAKNSYFWVEKAVSEIARENGVKTYSTLFVDDSGEKFDFDYMVMTALPGDNMKEVSPLNPYVERKILEGLGRQLATIHLVPTHGFGFFDNTIAKEKAELIGIHKKWEDHVLASLTNNLSYLTDSKTITVEDGKRVEKIFRTHTSSISCSSTFLIHNDIADHNTLVDTKSGKVTGILDWDECFSGDPVMDFAAWSVFYPFERMEHLKKGYQEITSLPDGFEEKLHIYRLRYIISKATIRSKKLSFQESTFNRNLLTYALEILQDEFLWFGQK